MAKCPECRRPIGRQIRFTDSQPRIPRPPPGTIEMLLALDILYATANQQILHGKDIAKADAAKAAFRAQMSLKWLDLRELVWRSIGRHANTHERPDKENP